MINVIGLGYIGLPTALMLATHGNKVVGTDLKKDLIEKLNNNKMTFKENGIDTIFFDAVKSGIKFTTEYQKADMYIVSVPTPYDKITKKIDSHYVEEAVKNILKICNDDSIIVIESTVSPGTINRKIRPLLNKKISLVHAPERIIPGNMVYELIHNNRTIGADDRIIGEKVKNVYSSFCKAEIVITDIKTAEMTKVVENTFRAVNIAFANELAKICSSDSMDVYEIIKICNMHPRVNILQPGPGVGGHCISVDPWFLVGDYPNITNVIHNSMDTNANMPAYVYNRIKEIMRNNNINDIGRVGLYGLSYKENVDDTRESPTHQLLDVIGKSNIKIYDPFINRDEVDNQYHDFDKFLNDIDIVVIMVGHSEIRNSFDKLKNKIILDTRNIFSNQSGVYKL